MNYDVCMFSSLISSSSRKDKDKHGRKGKRLAKGNGSDRRVSNGKLAVGGDIVTLLKFDVERVGRLLVALDPGVQKDTELPGATVRELHFNFSLDRD